MTAATIAAHVENGATITETHPGFTTPSYWRKHNEDAYGLPGRRYGTNGVRFPTADDMAAHLVARRGGFGTELEVA